MKKIKKIIVILIIIILFIGLFGINIKKNGKFNYQIEQQNVYASLDNNIRSADKLIEKILSENELILLEEIGVYKFQYSRYKDDKWYSGLVNNKIHFNLNYNALIVISTDKIQFKNDNGKIIYAYNINDIYCKILEFNNPFIDTEKGLFGKKYNENEIVNMLDLEKDLLKKQIDSDFDTRKAEENLDRYIQELCFKFNIECYKDYNRDERTLGDATLV